MPDTTTMLDGTHRIGLTGLALQSHPSGVDITGRGGQQVYVEAADFAEFAEAIIQVPGHGGALYSLLAEIAREVARQDEKHGPFDGASRLGTSRLAVACLEDEVEEVRLAWRAERKADTFAHTREEAIQVAAVAIRAVRDALNR